MSHFRPLRSSPPPRPQSITNTLVPTSAVSDVSRSSMQSTPELAALTADEISFIDEVISRASSSATTFLSVFKAYNDVLQERGLDPQNEIVYYGKLLKLGTLKGSNWGEKWRAVKKQYGYTLSSAKAGFAEQAAAPPKSSAARLLQRLKAFQHTREPSDSPELRAFSPTDLTEDTETDSPASPFVPLRTSSPALHSTTGNSLGLDVGHPPRRAIPPPTSSHWSAQDSQILSTLSTTPPSYRTTTREPHKIRFAEPKSAPRHPHAPRPYSASALKPMPALPQQRGADEEDAWAKIRMEQDQQDADRFREDRLVERCWDVWKQGYAWTITTSQAMTLMRNSLILRRALHKWTVRVADRRALEAQVQAMAEQRCLRQALHTWTGALRRKRQEAWRNEMRARMRVVREKREGKLRKDAWAKWRQLYQSRLSQQHYAERLVLRTFGRWRGKLGQLDRREEDADRFVTVCESRMLKTTWDWWRKAVQLRALEIRVATRVAVRTKAYAFASWKRRIANLEQADALYDRLVLKRAIVRWKVARQRIRALERRADKNVARSEDVLLRAVTRIWRARQLGQQLDLVRAMRSERLAWQTWRQRFAIHREREAKAIKFASRTQASTVVSALQTWRSRTSAHHMADALALQYRTTQLQYKILYIWRLYLRTKLKMARKARAAEKYFVLRHACEMWRRKLDERRVGKRLEDFLRLRTQRLFDTWLQRTVRKKQHRIAEQEINNRVTTRVLKRSLNVWTNRVIALKIRELEVATKNDRALLFTVMRKWKGVCIRHVEELSLMESYQDVKREESMRRMFYKWLTAARTVRHQKQVLQEAEGEMRRRRLAIVWDQWRGRFETEKLLPIERNFALQTRHSLMYRAFATWHSKTNSLPAVRFHASHAKAKFWQKWRDAMPKALQAKAAREKDRKSVLARIFGKWLQAYRTKLALRAVMRARNMGLPSATSTKTPRQPLLSRPLPPSSSRSIFPRTTPLHPAREPDTDSDTQPERPPRASRSRSPVRPFAARSSIASLLAPRPSTRETGLGRPRLSTRSHGAREPSPDRSRPSRDPSPARTATSQPASSAGRGSLWQELQEIQRRRARTPG